MGLVAVAWLAALCRVAAPRPRGVAFAWLAALCRVVALRPHGVALRHRRGALLARRPKTMDDWKEWRRKQGPARRAADAADDFVMTMRPDWPAILTGGCSIGARCASRANALDDLTFQRVATSRCVPVFDTCADPSSRTTCEEHGSLTNHET